MDFSAEHRAALEVLSQRIRYFYDEKIPVRVYHGSTNSTRAQKNVASQRVLDLSNFNRILKINREQKYALVEPNISMDMLVKETLKHGLVPPVVMEFPGITVGGGIQGGAAESSSFKEGLFHECCEEYEMLLGNGEIITASPTNNPDLFWGTACSYGTLGVITAIKVKLVPATQYVRLRYIRVGSVSQSIETIRREAETGADFIDSIMFSSRSGVVMSGIRTNEQSSGIARFSRAFDPWFYLHARDVATKQSVYEETVPLTDYLFRYDRGGFWVGYYGFKRYGIPFNKFTRLIFNPFLKTRSLYEILHATNTSQQGIVQDICLPEDKAESFFNFIDRDIQLYPLWICPLKPDNRTPLSPTFIETDAVINVGVYGQINQYDYETMYDLNRKIENAAIEFGGRKVLYAHTYYPKEQFWNIYNEMEYDNLRKKYFADRTFPSIYDKVHVAEKYVSHTKRGLGRLILKKLARQPIV